MIGKGIIIFAGTMFDGQGVDSPGIDGLGAAAIF